MPERSFLHVAFGAGRGAPVTPLPLWMTTVLRHNVPALPTMPATRPLPESTEALLATVVHGPTADEHTSL